MSGRTIRLRGKLAPDDGIADNPQGTETDEIKDGAVTAAKLATNAVETAKIKDANVTLAKLAAGIKPVGIVVGFGEFTTAGGDANESIPVTGALNTDIPFVFLKTAGASPTTVASFAAAAGAINVVMSDDPSTDHVLFYFLLRTAA